MHYAVGEHRAAGRALAADRRVGLAGQRLVVLELRADPGGVVEETHDQVLALVAPVSRSDAAEIRPKVKVGNLEGPLRRVVERDSLDSVNDDCGT